MDCSRCSESGLQAGDQRSALPLQDCNQSAAADSSLLISSVHGQDHRAVVLRGGWDCLMHNPAGSTRITHRLSTRFETQVLLRSLPVKPFSLIVGQLALPILITWTFQLTTITIAALVIHPGWDQFILWTSMLLALAILTFAAENALFLAYPHHQHNEGIAMMLRTKLTFLGKGTVLVMPLFLLVLWATLCRNLIPEPYASARYISGSITASWMAAFLGLAAATLCWRRFDIAIDTPPE